MAAISYLKAPEYKLVMAELATTYELGLIDLWALTETRHEYFVDGVHPNELGANIIASKLHNTTGNEINQYLMQLRDESQSNSNLSLFAYFDNLIFMVLTMVIIKSRNEWLNP